MRYLTPAALVGLALTVYLLHADTRKRLTAQDTALAFLQRSTDNLHGVVW